MLNYRPAALSALAGGDNSLTRKEMTLLSSPFVESRCQVFEGRSSVLVSLVCTTPPVVPLAKEDKMRPQAASVSLKG
jgi:hypothetical protein